MLIYTTITTGFFFVLEEETNSQQSKCICYGHINCDISTSLFWYVKIRERSTNVCWYVVCLVPIWCFVSTAFWSEANVNKHKSHAFHSIQLLESNRFVGMHGSIACDSPWSEIELSFDLFQRLPTMEWIVIVLYVLDFSGTRDFASNICWCCEFHAM